MVLIVLKNFIKYYKEATKILKTIKSIVNYEARLEQYRNKK